MRDKLSIERIAKLHPLVRTAFTSFIEAAETELNIILRVTQGLRTIAEQNALYAQGRTTAGKIVTNAKGGKSYHNWGMAIDVVPIANGVADWNFDYNKLYPIAQRFGIEWGGAWKSLVDKPHFQITFKQTVAQLAKKPVDADGYVLI